VISFFALSLATKVIGWFAYFFTNDESSGVIGWLEILDILALYVNVLILYFLVYEMRLVKLEISIIITEEKRRKLMKTKVERIILITAATCI